MDVFSLFAPLQEIKTFIFSDLRQLFVDGCTIAPKRGRAFDAFGVAFRKRISGSKCHLIIEGGVLVFFARQELVGIKRIVG